MLKKKKPSNSYRQTEKIDLMCMILIVSLNRTVFGMKELRMVTAPLLIHALLHWAKNEWAVQGNTASLIIMPNDSMNQKLIPKLPLNI